MCGWLGLGLLAVPIVKLFAYDAFELEQVYRVIAFIGLGRPAGDWRVPVPTLQPGYPGVLA